MRLDKFLKISRIIKRRQVAKELADFSRVLINERVAKPSSKVAVNDTLTLLFGNKKIVVKVCALLPYAKKDDVDVMYEIISEEKIND